MIRLMEREFDRNAEMRKKLVGSFLVGGNFAVKPGKRVGGTFAYIPTCSQPGEYGCVVTYSAFTSPPGGTALFGRIGPLNKAFGGPYGSTYAPACTNPAELAGQGNALKPVLRGAPQRRVGIASEQKRHRLFGHRTKADGDAAIVDRRKIAAKGCTERPQDVFGASPTGGEGDIDRVELSRISAADTNADPQPARREIVQCPQLLCQPERVAQRDEHDACADRDPLGYRSYHR